MLVGNPQIVCFREKQGNKITTSPYLPVTDPPPIHPLRIRKLPPQLPQQRPRPRRPFSPQHPRPSRRETARANRHNRRSTLYMPSDELLHLCPRLRFRFRTGDH